MNRAIQWIWLVALASMLAGCAMYAKKSPAESSLSAGMSGAPADAAGVPADRMLIWRASLTLEVRDVTNAMTRAAELAARHRGFVEQKSDRGAGSASMTLRIPTKDLAAVLSGCEALGEVIQRQVSSEDVTEQYVDVAARLKNRIVLRDRLKELLAKATEVKDVLAIETELNRVQGDIDSMEGRIKSLKGQADYAAVFLSFERQPILGPVGCVLKGLWWGVRKLFVIRD